VLATFYSGAISHDSVIRIELQSTRIAAHATELAGTAAQETLAAHRKRHEEALPSNPEELLAWLIAMSGGELLALLAYCVAVRVDGVQSTEGPSALDALAKVAKLDMRRWWKATAENYFGSIPKSRILAVISEAVSASAAASLANLKKDALAQAAERQLADKSWLPMLMRDSE
jgi:ParB family chromosome partitioning protein